MTAVPRIYPRYFSSAIQTRPGTFASVALSEECARSCGPCAISAEAPRLTHHNGSIMIATWIYDVPQQYSDVKVDVHMLFWLNLSTDMAANWSASPLPWSVADDDLLSTSWMHTNSR